DPVVVADAPYALEELRRRDDETAFALDGLDDDCCDGFRGDGGQERSLERGKRSFCAWTSVVLCKRESVHLRGKRAEPFLVRMRLGCERQGQQRATVEASFEADHGRSLRVRARELHRV